MNDTLCSASASNVGFMAVKWENTTQFQRYPSDLIDFWALPDFILFSFYDLAKSWFEDFFWYQQYKLHPHNKLPLSDPSNKLRVLSLTIKLMEWFFYRPQLRLTTTQVMTQHKLFVNQNQVQHSTSGFVTGNGQTAV